MTSLTDQQLAANFMGALAHLLTGRPGRHAEFIDRVEVLLSGSEPHAMQLMQFTDRVRRTGRPVLWIHHAADVPNVPQIGLVALDGGQTFVFENCLLWMSGGSRARLIPDCFAFGAFRLDDDLQLRRSAKAPASSFRAAQPAMARAYRRLIDLQVEQIRRGDVFALPLLAKAA